MVTGITLLDSNPFMAKRGVLFNYQKPLTDVHGSGNKIKQGRGAGVDTTE